MQSRKAFFTLLLVIFLLLLHHLLGSPSLAATSYQCQCLVFPSVGLYCCHLSYFVLETSCSHCPPIFLNEINIYPFGTFSLLPQLPFHLQFKLSVWKLNEFPTLIHFPCILSFSKFTSIATICYNRSFICSSCWPIVKPNMLLTTGSRSGTQIISLMVYVWISSSIIL